MDRKTTRNLVLKDMDMTASAAGAVKGGVVTLEYLFVATILAIGLTVGLSSAKAAPTGSTSPVSRGK